MSYWNPFHPLSVALNKNRIFGLDLLRAIAIGMILYGHCTFMLPVRAKNLLSMLIVVDPVTMFFVLSGFLIGRILLDTIEFEKLTFRSLLRFWLRRWMRTVPAYLATLILLAVIYQKLDGKFLLSYVFFVQNLNWPHPGWFPEAWSLSNEEVFYFLIPLLLFFVIFLLKQDPRKTFLFTCLAVILLTPVYRWYRYESLAHIDLTEWDQLFRKQVSTRMDSIMYGALGAYFFRFQASIWTRNKALCLFTGLSLILTTYIYNYGNTDFENLYVTVLSFSIESFAVLLIIPFFVEIKRVNGIIARGVTVVSILSYSLYLLNLSFVLVYVCNKVPGLGLFGWAYISYKVALFWSLTFGSAIILYLVVEHPFLLLRDRITKVGKDLKGEMRGTHDRLDTAAL